MDTITGIFGDDGKFSELLRETTKRAAQSGVAAGVVGVIHPDGTLWLEWVGIPSQALGLASRLEYEIHTWLDENG